MGRGWSGRLAQGVRRELSYVRAQAAGLAKAGSYQRLQVLQIAKATLAAVLAWLAASKLLAAQATWIAPATAVITVYATVYRTLTNGLRRVAAVGAGVVLAGGIGHLLGLGVLSLVLVVPPALVAARWHRMGRHGSDVATTAVLLTSVAGGLRDGWNLSGLPDWERQYARDYADLLDLLAEAPTATVRRAADPERARDLLGRAHAQAGRIHHTMTSEIREGQVDHPAGWALSGSLLTDAERILAALTDTAPGPTP